MLINSKNCGNFADASHQFVRDIASSLDLNVPGFGATEICPLQFGQCVVQRGPHCTEVEFMFRKQESSVRVSLSPNLGNFNNSKIFWWLWLRSVDRKSLIMLINHISKTYGFD